MDTVGLPELVLVLGLAVLFGFGEALRNGSLLRRNVRKTDHSPEP
jgi:hypothetical protein